MLNRGGALVATGGVAKEAGREGALGVTIEDGLIKEEEDGAEF